MGGKIMNTNRMNRSIMKWYTVYDVPYMYLCCVQIMTMYERKFCIEM